MPSNKHQSNEIKKELADTPKNSNSITAFFRYTIISCYSFVAIGSTQGLGGIYRFKNSTEHHNSALKCQKGKCC